MESDVFAADAAIQTDLSWTQHSKIKPRLCENPGWGLLRSYLDLGPNNRRQLDLLIEYYW